ncbi:phosphotransferase enzyme family protein [Paenibacillus spongiae]|uniref:Phosphotransferase n=1 Tax=Paenibacillus spongiae TaxID=2909671 RepID=A0ABY5S9T8_9BACL|nr:phosphotransferase [Paenibacillus spongiae]UVI30499.1 phosphotransferase [Paenibacillus spongiae]
MQAKFDELVRHYFEDCSSYEMEPVPFGLTNLTRVITIHDVNYIARIYNPHTKNVPSLELESRITSYLSQSGLSFQVPVFLRTLTGDEYIQFADGTLGAVVSFLEGSPPELTDTGQAYGFGRVVGEISSALSHCDTRGLGFRGISFMNIYKLHPLADHRTVASFIDEPPFHIPEDDQNFYREMVSLVERSISQLQQLPAQLVHHDLLVFNLLARDNQICGVLDFDFTSMDAGFMEFAISLNHILQLSDGSLDMMDAFVKGYAAFRKSSGEEIDQLQLLTQVYHIAVLHIYIGQHYAGKDAEQPFKYILAQFRDRNDWLNDNWEATRRLLETCLL